MRFVHVRSAARWRAESRRPPGSRTCLRAHLESSARERVDRTWGSGYTEPRACFCASAGVDSVKVMIAVALGGGAGSVCRYGITLWALRALGPRFAFGTLAANVLGCFALGFLLHVLAESEAASRALRLGLTTGFLGGFTTFSTFGYETIRYWETGETSLAVANVLANVVLGLLATWGGLSIARMTF